MEILSVRSCWVDAVARFLTPAPLRPKPTPVPRRYGAARKRIQGVFLAAALVSILGPWAAAPTRAADPITLVALGDSLTAGYNLPQDAAFPVRLEAALRAKGLDVTVLNAGVSGDTSKGGLARVDWMLGDHPDGVIVELGANDGLRGLDPERTRENLDAIITRLKAEGVAVLLAGMMAPPNLGKDYGAAFNALYGDLAEAHGVLLYPFFLDGVAMDPNLNQDDGIHPTAEGVDIIVARMLPKVEELIARVEASRAQR
jgi:acyl-CoA thioesterase-1